MYPTQFTIQPDHIVRGMLNLAVHTYLEINKDTIPKLINKFKEMQNEIQTYFIYIFIYIYYIYLGNTFCQLKYCYCCLY